MAFMSLRSCSRLSALGPMGWRQGVSPPPRPAESRELPLAPRTPRRRSRPAWHAAPLRGDRPAWQDSGAVVRTVQQWGLWTTERFPRVRPMNLTIQPYQPEEMDPVLRVLAEAMAHDPIPAARFIQQVLLDANFRVEGALVARAEGQVAGFCLAIARQVPMENAPPDGERGYVTLIGVSPSHQRRGIGSRLLIEAEAYLRAQGRTVVTVAPYAPGYFLPGVDVEAYASGLEFFLKHGYRE